MVIMKKNRQIFALVALKELFYNSKDDLYIVFHTYGFKCHFLRRSQMELNVSFFGVDTYLLRCV